MGGGHAGEEVRGAGPAGDEAYARTIGDARQTVGHEGRGLLVADVDVLDARVVVEPIEDVQKRRPDDPEHVTDPFGLQELYDRPSTRPLVHEPGTSCARRRVARHRIPGDQA